MEAYLTENCPPTFHFRGRAPPLPFQLHPAAALCQRLENAINTSVFNSSSLQKGGVGSIWLCTRVRVPWPLAARCLAVCVEPFVMFLPDGGGGGTHRASRNVALIVFFDFLVSGIQPRIRPICVRTILAFEPVCCDLLDSNF